MLQWKEQRGSSLPGQHLHVQKPNRKSFEDSQSPSINFSQPWIQPSAHSWMTHWWGFSPEQRQKEEATLRAGWGPCWWDPSVFFQEATGQADSICSNIYSALMGAEQKYYQPCLIARGFLNLSGPRMGLFPTNPLSLPRVWGDHVFWAFDELPPLWSHSHENHVQLLGWWEGGGEVKGLLKAGKQIHS